MIKFQTLTEKLDFLKKYKLAPKSASELPVFYYFKPSSDTPSICEIIGYDAVYDSWAVVTIKADDKMINIHSDYLLEMKRKGTAFQKNNSEIAMSENDPNAYVVFDLETTGKLYSKHEIIEIAAIKYINHNVYEFDELINIESIIPLDITSLTGINNDMLSEADTLEVVLPKFLKFIGNCRLVGHNIKAFDIHFINKACRDLKLPEVENEIIDTLQLSRNILPDLVNHRLATICDYFGIDNSNAHRALNDCFMCNECFIKLTTKQDFQSNLQIILDNTIQELELPKKSLILQQNRGQKKVSFSVFINEPTFPATKDDLEKINTTQSILNFEEKENMIIFSVTKNTAGDIPIPSNTRLKEEKAFTKVFLPVCHPEIYTYVKNIIHYRIKLYVSSSAPFGCCSKFVECSDAKKCVHENKLYATACMYRMNLESGRIFYGKNRNID